MTTAPPDDLTPLKKAFLVIRQLRETVEDLRRTGSDPIAIVGMGCRLPGAADADAFWELVRDGRDMITPIPEDRWDVAASYDPTPGTPGKTYARHGGFLDRVDGFDAAFFGLSAREAEAVDPQQRLLLEVAWEALENAGLVPERLIGTATGVFVGVTASDYALLQIEQDDGSANNPYFNTGTPLNGCAGRLSYVLGLQGPAMAVDTACSSSLSAIHLACASLRAGECDQALAGGVNLILSPRLYVTLAAAGMLAADGRCKTFDAAADGYVRGEGCGLVVLKRLRDAEAAGDRILALIHASAANQDGASSGLTVPNGTAQQKLIRQALAKAKIAPDAIDYVEAHGTGTALGDVIEIQALGTVLGQAEGRARPLLVGSVKSNIGHLESAAGVAGLIKLIQSLRHDTLPPTLHVQAPNPGVDWQGLKVAPLLAGTTWRRGERPRLAGLSSFGATGSNVHLIIGEAPEPAPPPPAGTDRPAHILTLSAKSEAALRDLAARYGRLLEEAPATPLADLCHGANTARSHFPHRAALVAGNAGQARARLADLVAGRQSPCLFVGAGASDKPFRPVFLFSGQGALRAGAGQALYDTVPRFRRTLERCAEILAPRLERPLLAALYPENGADNRLLDRATYAQPALFALQYALADLWRSWGLAPVAVLGHSLGEYCAACVAGALELEDALALVAERARLMDTLKRRGGMAAIFAEPARVRDAVARHGHALALAAVNGPANVVVSGDETALARVVERFGAEGVSSVSLAVTHAFHSPLMDPILDEFERFAAGIAARPPRLPMAITPIGRLAAADDRLDAAYWRRHCREPVLFADSLDALLGQDFTAFIEIGPGAMLTQLGRRRDPSAVWRASLSPPRNDWEQIVDSLAEAYARGAAVDWSGFDAPFVRGRAALPTYPFQRKSHWFATTGTLMDSRQALPTVPARDDRDFQRDEIFAKLRDIVAAMLRVEPGAVNPSASFLEMGADSLVLVETMRLIDDTFGVKLEMRQFFEDVSTVAALADHLVDRSTFSLPTADAAPRPAAPAPVAPAPMVAPVPATPAAAAPAPMSVTPPPIPALGHSALEQVIAAQMQIMSQQLALLQGAPLAAAAPPAAPPAVKATPSVTTPPAAAEDRSSPLRALAHPVSTEPLGNNPRQERFLAALVERFQARTSRSKALAQDCRAGLADSRASVGFRFSTKEILYPITGAEALGARLTDVDGNDYLDMTMGFGVLLFGNRPDFLLEAIDAEMKRGIQLGPRSDLMGEVTALFRDLTGHERVAFTNSGTEAVMTALRLARAATGRTRIAMFEGSYHGHSDGTLARTVRTGDGLRSEPLAPGVPGGVAEDVLVLPYGTDESLDILGRHAHELAAVLVEPVQSRRPDFRPVEFLRRLRTLTEASGTALIFDEMITGFRAHPGGAQALFGIRADIATYGKILGGGLPIGAVAGSARFLDGIDGGFWSYGDQSFPAAPRTYFGGTFCQHPFAMAASLAVLRHLKAEGPDLQEAVDRRTAHLADTLNAFFEREELPIKVTYFSSLFRFVSPGNIDLLYYLLLEKGVYIWEWRNCFLSTAHTDEDVAFFIRAVQDSVEDLRRGGFLPEREPAPAARPAAEHQHAFWDRRKSKLGLKEATLAPLPRAGVTGERRAMDFSLFFFGPYSADFSAGKYDVIVEGARYADREGFAAIWLPERHFHEFGGFSPNPAVVAAALARETGSIQLRAGSVVAPLHDPIRVAEEWSVVDNLSGGRIGIGFASGWHADDFVFAPETYDDRRELTFERIETVRGLWRGEKLRRRGGGANEVELAIYPRPKQPELPTWLAIVNNRDTYRRCAEAGIGVLTNLMGQSLEDLAANIALYRRTLAENGHDPASGHVTVLIHTYLHADDGQAVDTARQPLCDYLLSSIGLFQRMAQVGGNSIDLDRLTDRDKAFMVGKAYEKYVGSSALIGSPESCAPIIDRLCDIGVDEVACFVDFGIEPSAVLSGLPVLDQLRRRYLPEPAPAVDPLPTGEAQRQLWVLAHLSEDGSRAYNDPAALALNGPLAVPALERAMAVVVTRHDALRTTFDASGEHRIIHPAALAALTLVDLSGDSNPEAALEVRLAENAHHRFDLAKGPLFVPILYRLATERHVLLLLAHHICSDGPAMNVVLREVLTAYQAIRRGDAPDLPTPLQYDAFLRWQRDNRGAAAMAAHEAFWLQRFAQPVPALDLPSDHPRPPVKTYRGQRLWSHLSPDLLDRARQLGGAHNATLYMVLLAAFFALLHRLTDQDDLVVGCPYSGRGLPGGQGLVGYCVHLLAIRGAMAADLPFADHLRAVRTALLDAFDHQDYPFARLIDRLGLKRDSSRAPLVGVVFNLERQTGRQTVADLDVAFYRQPVAFTPHDLTLTVFLEADGAAIACDYNTDLFERATVQGLVDQYRTLLDAATRTPDQPLAALPLLSDEARRHYLRDWTESAPAAAPATYPTLWAERAARFADRVALIDESAGGVCLTYGELERRANRLAHRLRRLGVGPEDRVGLCLERSWQVVVALLGTLKAGAAFVPLDPAYPRARLDMMRRDAGIAALVTREGLLERLPDLSCPVLCVDRDRADLETEPATPPAIPLLPDNLAYVIYTSGSTGKPKGVMISHRAFVNYVNWAAQAYMAEDGDGAPVLGSIGFDATLTSLFVPPLGGRPVVILTDGNDVEALTALGHSSRHFNFVKLTPAHLDLLNTLTDGKPPARLARHLVLGGEALNGASVEPWLQDGATRVINEYGPTETVVGCCIHAPRAPVAGVVPIGRPIAGTRLLILDRRMALAPPGVPGELYIGGAGLARGYLGRGDLTAAAFVPDPFSESGAERLYRTGDRASILADGTITCLGRMDRQIKLHGFRIEPGEIETILADLPGVREAAVVLREDQPGHPELVGYVRPAAPLPSAESLRQALQDRLPPHMVPGAIVAVAEMPLTANGKIDRARLPAPDHTRPQGGQAPARTAVERELVEIWRVVLGVETVGIHDNFFDLGGDSFRLLQVCSRLGHLLDRDAAVIALFKHPTIAALAGHLSQRHDPAPAAGIDQAKSRAQKQHAATRKIAARRRKHG